MARGRILCAWDPASIGVGANVLVVASGGDSVLAHGWFGHWEMSVVVVNETT